jgi:alpha-ketoglutarate-dependent taurine dioxygenase
MVRGWEMLPADLKAKVDGLEARHGHDDKYPNRGGDDDVIDAVFTEAKFTICDVARRHPRTGKTTLYVSQQVTQDIVGLSPDDNEELLEELFEHLYAPDNVYAHEWRTGDLVVWDNQALQHARSKVELEGPTRTLRKVFAPAPEHINPGAMPTFSKVAQAT